MKKYLIIAILTSISFAVNAQKTQFSVVGGLQNAAVQGDFLDQAFNTGNGFYIGFGSEFSLTDRSSLYSELTYSSINGTDYFQLPVLFKYQFSEKWSILAGPQIGYISGENTRFVNNISFGISAGLQYDFSDKLYGMLRYTYQLNDLYDGPFNTSYKIDMASIGIGLKF